VTLTAFHPFIIHFVLDLDCIKINHFVSCVGQISFCLKHVVWTHTQTKWFTVCEGMGLHTSILTYSTETKNFQHHSHSRQNGSLSRFYLDFFWLSNKS